MKRWLLFGTVLLLLSCQPQLIRQEAPVIYLKGSDTMLVLAERWAEAFMKAHHGVAVYVEGGGTTSGFQALIDGDVHICAASRPIRPSEAKQMAEKHSTIGINFLVAKDALSVYLNPKNPVTTLSMAELKKIFSGETNNWSAVGGIDAPIKRIVRPPNSGTYLYFKEHVLGGNPYAEDADVQPSTDAVVAAVTNDIAAIGYGGLAYGADVRHCRIDSIQASEANVRNDSYPIVRYLYLYTIDTPQGMPREFINWVLREGQQLVRDVGYIPLWVMNE